MITSKDAIHRRLWKCCEGGREKLTEYPVDPTYDAESLPFPSPCSRSLASPGAEV